MLPAQGGESLAQRTIPVEFVLAIVAAPEGILILLPEEERDGGQGEKERTIPRPDQLRHHERDADDDLILQLDDDVPSGEFHSAPILEPDLGIIGHVAIDIVTVSAAVVDHEKNDGGALLLHDAGRRVRLLLRQMLQILDGVFMHGPIAASAKDIGPHEVQLRHQGRTTPSVPIPGGGHVLLAVSPEEFFPILGTEEGDVAEVLPSGLFTRIEPDLEVPHKGIQLDPQSVVRQVFGHILQEDLH